MIIKYVIEMEMIESVKTFLGRVVDATFGDAQQKKWIKIYLYAFVAYILFQVIRAIF